MAELIKKTKIVKRTQNDGYVLRVSDSELEILCRALKDADHTTEGGRSAGETMRKLFLAVREAGYGI